MEIEDRISGVYELSTDNVEKPEAGDSGDKCLWGRVCGIEAVRGLRHKLRMIGIEIDGPTYFYRVNMLVVHNTLRPELTLKKKLNAICYHAVRESVAMGELMVTHVATAENPVDLCAKVLPEGQKRDNLTGMILWDTVE